MMKEEIKKACEVMNKGGVILYPTDTVRSVFERALLPVPQGDCVYFRQYQRRAFSGGL